VLECRAGERRCDLVVVLDRVGQRPDRLLVEPGTRAGEVRRDAEPLRRPRELLIGRRATQAREQVVVLDDEKLAQYAWLDDRYAEEELDGRELPLEDAPP
jgi:hypothetical protein